jgi:predicted Fe-S protein YdhL (DUF1289 family)
MADSPPDLPSPCTGVCRLDGAGEACTGCKRTLDEIATWSSLTQREKAAVLASLADRP